jgi:hypothetical protein
VFFSFNFFSVPEISHVKVIQHPNMEDPVGQVMSTSASSSKKMIQPGPGFTTTAARTPGDGGSSSGGASISGTGSNAGSAGKRPVRNADNDEPDVIAVSTASSSASAWLA